MRSQKRLISFLESHTNKQKLKVLPPRMSVLRRKSQQLKLQLSQSTIRSYLGSQPTQVMEQVLMQAMQAQKQQRKPSRGKARSSQCLQRRRQSQQLSHQPNQKEARSLQCLQRKSQQQQCQLMLKLYHCLRCQALFSTNR